MSYYSTTTTAPPANTSGFTNLYQQYTSTAAHQKCVVDYLTPLKAGTSYQDVWPISAYYAAAIVTLKGLATSGGGVSGQWLTLLGVGG